MLPNGGTAVFRERSHLSFAATDGALIASTRPLDRTCEGPSAICDAFLRLGASNDGQVLRFRIGLADRHVTLLDAVPAPLGSHGDETGTQVAAFVAQSEAAAPGAIIAADLRQLVRFAGVPLPAVGVTTTQGDGQIRLSHIDALHARIVIERDLRVADSVSLRGSGECLVSRMTGLAEECRFVDWLGDNRTSPIRVRETRIVPAPIAVS